VRASSCFAVGFAGFQLLDNAVQHANRTQVERWDGKRWSLVGGVDGGTQAGLARISCSSAVHCVAVGNRLDAAGAARAIGQQWNGASWSTVPVPSPAGAIESVLRDVDCWSAASCVAVGSYRTRSAEQTLVERWNGTKWSIVASPNPSGDRSTRLDALSCPSAARCVAVGRSSRTYADSLTGASKALVLTWSGASWSIVTTPDPSGEYGRRLSAVSCASASSCVAVGFDETDPHLGGQGNMLIESWDGMTWSVVVSAAAPLGSIVGGSLSGVSCSAASSCVAVGWDADGPLAERWDGATWSQLTDPEPVGADPADLWGITCSSASSCVAVGRHWSPGTGSRVLVESWNGASWSIAGTPDPATAYDSLLTGVSCPQATTCFAAGSFVDRAGSHTLIERYS